METTEEDKIDGVAVELSAIGIMEVVSAVKILDAWEVVEIWVEEVKSQMATHQREEWDLNLVEVEVPDITLDLVMVQETIKVTIMDTVTGMEIGVGK